MRNSVDSQALLSQIRRQVELVERSDFGEFFTRKLVADISKWSSKGFDFELRILGKLSLKEKIVLSIFQWYTSSEVLRVYLKLYLEEDAHVGLSEEDRFLLDIFQLSRPEMEIFLLDTSLWSTRDFFGNIFNERTISNVLHRIKVSIVTMPKPKYPERHRGYRDKGSWKKPHEVHSDYKNDWTSIKEQEEIVNRRKTRIDTLLFYFSDNSY